MAFESSTTTIPRDNPSAASEDSQTAADFINSQLQLEADAREALPYKFDTCTKPLGPLRQLLFACLTCNPPPTNPSDPYSAAAVCYSCSVACHGEHTLVELFHKRNFVCDCGTTRLPATAPCTLRLNANTGQKGGVINEAPEEKNEYNHNFRNRFCGCECDYDATQQKGTMYQCMGLGTERNGGCGEDWWHPTCVVGLDTSWYEKQAKEKAIAKPTVLDNADTLTVPPPEDNESDDGSEDDTAIPPGFPPDNEWDGFICYKCVEANPWIKSYAGTDMFLQPVFRRSMAPSPEGNEHAGEEEPNLVEHKTAAGVAGASVATSQKRKAEDHDTENKESQKRIKTDNGDTERGTSLSDQKLGCKVKNLPEPPKEPFSLFFKDGFREKFCRCSDCFPNLARHPQLLEPEDDYEPPISEEGDDGANSTVGSGSLLDRGERALSNMDRVKAIEGVMAFNHLKEKLTPFFKEFAESGKAISAEDIKAHFAKMRGDEAAIKEAGEAAAKDSVNNRREQDGR